MSSKRLLRKKADLTSIGSMSKEIYIYSRNIKTIPSAKFELNLTNGTHKWATLSTVSGVDIFDDNNEIKGVATHIFSIRADSTLTSEKWLKYDNRYFEILNIDHLNENGRFSSLLCCERGSTIRAVNKL